MADEIECPRKEHSAWSWFQILESLRSDWMIFRLSKATPTYSTNTKPALHHSISQHPQKHSLTVRCSEALVLLQTRSI